MTLCRTIQEAFRQASSFLRAAKIESPEWEAEYLLRDLLQLDRTQFFSRMGNLFPIDREGLLEKWLERRGQQEPLQYIVESQEFFGRLFRVSPAVLIPRPETEQLVLSVLEEAEKWCSKRELQGVDVGTGSGCIAITLLKERPDWKMRAVDLSPQALEVARRNAERHHCMERIQFVEGSFLEPIQEPFDFLVSNPPYISQEDLKGLEKQVRDYEPHLALDGGPDGLEPYHILVEQLSRLRKPNRVLVAFEIGADQGEAVLKEVESLPGFVRGEVRKDFADRDRIVITWLEAASHI